MLCFPDQPIVHSILFSSKRETPPILRIKVDFLVMNCTGEPMKTVLCGSGGGFFRFEMISPDVITLFFTSVMRLNVFHGKSMELCNDGILSV